MALHYSARRTHRQSRLRIVCHPGRQAVADQLLHPSLMKVPKTLMPQHLGGNRLGDDPRADDTAPSSSRLLARLRHRRCREHRRRRALRGDEPRSTTHLCRGHQGKHPTTRMAQPRRVLQEGEALLPQPRPRDQVRREPRAAPHVVKGGQPGLALRTPQLYLRTPHTGRLLQLPVGHFDRATRMQRLREQRSILEGVLGRTRVKVHLHALRDNASRTRKQGTWRHLRLRRRRCVPKKRIPVADTASARSRRGSRCGACGGFGIAQRKRGGPITFCNQ